MKTPSRIFDLTKTETVTMTIPELQELVMEAVAAAFAEQIEYMSEHFPRRTQTANRLTQTMLLEIEATKSVKH